MMLVICWDVREATWLFRLSDALRYVRNDETDEKTETLRRVDRKLHHGQGLRMGSANDQLVV